jgi:Iap family predicted aminopeptidase
MIKKLFAILLLSSAFFTNGQNCKKLDPDQISRLKSDISILASDSLEGRETGTAGERLALDYLVKEYQAMDLDSYETGGLFVQPFSFQRRVKVDKKTYFALDGNALLLGGDYFPVKYSIDLGSYYGRAVHIGYGILAPELEHNDYDIEIDLEGKAVIMDVGSPDGIHPHSKFLKYHDIGTRIEVAVNRGAKAVILVNQGEHAEDPEANFKSLMSREIPVIFLKSSDGLAKGDIVLVNMKVKMSSDTDLGHNLVVHLNNQAEKTIVLAAHYDHLGWGIEGSRYMGPPLVHNGADDNASGTSGVLELARYLSQRPKGTENYNYIFLAFSGEELGLLGSKHFVENMGVPAERILCMINYDMIGSLEEDGSGLIINGIGTSPEWKAMLEAVKCKEVSFTTTESGVGPSDHTSFYWKEIPAIHFFTGSTTNYHKPTDDPESINYEGLARVVQFTEMLIKRLNKQTEMPFTKTKEEEQGKRSMKFKVTMGVMPDYAYEGEGMKIDGVIEGKPAAMAGLQGGDIVVKIGDMTIGDMTAYMTALGVFEPGQTVPVLVLRDGEEIEFQLTF